MTEKNDPILATFYQAKEKFEKNRSQEEGAKVMVKITELVNYLGENFSNLDGSELTDIRMRLAGYKFYLADYISEMNRISEAFKMELKEIKAKRWDEISEIIKSEKGKVSNKEQIENAITIETRYIQNEQTLYETRYYKYRLKLSAIDDILTALVQRIAELKKLAEQTK